MTAVPRSPKNPSEDLSADTSDHRSDADKSVKRIAKSGIANLFGAGLSAVSGFLLVVLVSRLWSPETAGTVFAVSSIFLIALALSEIGVDQGLVRFIAWNNARSSPHSNRSLVINGMTAVAAVSVLVLTFAVIFADPLARTLSGGADPGPAAGMIVVFASALPVASGYELVLAVTRGFTHMRPTIVIERIIRPVLQVVAVLAAALSGGGAPALAIAWVAPYAVALVLALAALGRTLRAEPDALLAGAPGTGREASSEFWRFTLPRGAARLAQVGLQRADIAIVTIVAGPASAALYTAVTRFLVLGQLATTALQQVSEPHLAKLLAKGNLDGAKRVTQQLTLWTVLLAWPVYLTFIVYGERLLATIFGHHYAQGATSLQLLSLAMLFATAIGPLDMLLLMAGRSTLSLINTVTALALDVLGCLVLVPVMGILGAAAAWTVSIVARNIMCFIQVRRTLGISPASARTMRLTGVVVVIFLAIPFLFRATLPGGIFLDAAIVAASTAGYAAFLWWRRKTLVIQG